MFDLLALTSDTLDRAGIDHNSVSIIELNRSVPERTAVALVVFVDDHPEPVAFLKATTHAPTAMRLEAEHETLSSLQAHASPVVARSVPTPLHVGQRGGVTVLAESILPGRRMKNLPPNAYFASREFRRHLDDILAWLEAFHAYGGRAVTPEDDDPAAVVTRFRAGFDRSPALDSLLDATVERLADRASSRSPWHGDFCSANILVRPGGGIGVIDWENPLVGSWPLLDLIHGLSSIWCVRYRKGQAALVENYRRLFFGRHPLRPVLAESVAGHAERIGIARDDILAWSVLGWATYADRKRARDAAANDWPLIMLDGKRCLNLEVFAEDPDAFIWPETPR